MWSPDFELGGTAVEVKVLASKKSYPNVGTAVHNIYGATVGCCNVRIMNVRDNFRKLLAGSMRSFASGSLSNLLGLNKAVLKASHRGPFGGKNIVSSISGPTLVLRGVQRVKLSYIIYVNKGKARGATTGFTTVNMGVISIPGAVSGSV